MEAPKLADQTTGAEVTDDELFGVPDLPEDDIAEADRVSNAVPLDATEAPVDDDADFEEVEVSDDE